MNNNQIQLSKSIQIGGKTISETSPIFIIAEIGVNHNGSLELAKKLVLEAKRAGADAVKFQTFRADTLVTRKAKMATYQVTNIGSETTQYQMLKNLELSYEDHEVLFKYCQDEGIIFLSTPFDVETAIFLNDLGVTVFKIGSSDTNNFPLLQKIARFGKPLLISTGMSSWEDVDETVVSLAGITKDILLLQCTTNYPCSPEEAHVAVLDAFRKRYGGLVGFSDHTIGYQAALVSAAFNAQMIEKHFTLDRNLPGPDHVCSVEPKDLAKLVSKVRELEHVSRDKRKELLKPEVWYNTYVGKPEKFVQKSVLDSRVDEIAKKSLILASDVEAGDVLTEKHIVVKRPGTGILPKYYYEVLGRVMNKAMPKDTVLKWEDLK